jgi:hypothetical protein
VGGLRVRDLGIWEHLYGAAEDEEGEDKEGPAQSEMMVGSECNWATALGAKFGIK